MFFYRLTLYISASELILLSFTCLIFTPFGRFTFAKLRVHAWLLWKPVYSLLMHIYLKHLVSVASVFCCKVKG